jgi:hypothetical protein
MPQPADKVPENIDFVATELLEAPEADRPAMLENIAKALTRRLLKDEPGFRSSTGRGARGTGSSNRSERRGLLGNALN